MHAGLSLVFQNLDGEQRYQADRGPRANRLGAAVDLERVVVEPVLFVPQAAAAETIHRVGDRDEVFEKL